MPCVRNGAWSTLWINMMKKFFAAALFAVLLLFKLAFNKDVAINKIFNVTAVAMLPAKADLSGNLQTPSSMM